jgi:hypothetical protein
MILYIERRNVDMPQILKAMLLAAVVIAIAVLNVLEFLPDWTTYAAILVLPFITSLRRCLPRRKGAAN